MQEVTAGERAAMMGEDLFLDLPPDIWDNIVANWNRRVAQVDRRDLLVSVEYAPLLKAVYEAGRSRP